MRRGFSTHAYECLKNHMTQLIHNLGHSIELRTSPQSEHPLWRYVYGDGKPKPYFHPLCAPISGIPLTNFEPYDHSWHRGLWFAIKYVNGTNFWEEPEAHGVQVTKDVPHVRQARRASNILIRSQLYWTIPDGQEVLKEYRNVLYRPLSNDSYALDWTVWLSPAGDTLLDRTPFTTWGGYGGLCLRGARHWRETKFLLPGGETAPSRRGQSSPWCELNGRLDGGKDLSAGIAIFDHPKNPRHPTPFYGHAGDDQKGGPMLNPAFLFHEPLTIPADADDYFLLRYRVLVHEGLWTAEQLQDAYDDWSIDPS